MLQQIGFSWVQDGIKMVLFQFDQSWPQVGSKLTQVGSSWSQDGLNWGQIGSGQSKLAAKWPKLPQIGPKFNANWLPMVLKIKVTQVGPTPSWLQDGPS